MKLTCKANENLLIEEFTEALRVSKKLDVDVELQFNNGIIQIVNWSSNFYIFNVRNTVESCLARHIELLKSKTSNRDGRLIKPNDEALPNTHCHD